MALEFNEESDLSRDANINNNHADRLLYSRFEKSSKTPTIISLLISTHIVKNEDHARLLLLIITIAIFALSIYLMAQSFSGPVFIDKIKK
jgi:hypothetical protein